MNVGVYTRVFLNLITAVFFSQRLIHSVSSLSLLDERIDHPRAEEHPVNLLLGNSFTLTRDVTLVRPKHATRPVDGLLRIPGQTHGRDPPPPAEDYLPKFNRLPDVSVNCSSNGFVLRVKRIFYGFSATPEELTLGETCKSNGVPGPHNDLLFTYALTDCQAEKQVLPEYILYKYVLRYVPLSRRPHFRSRQVNVGVECRFKRHHVHSDVVKPMYQVPLRKSIRSRLGDFRIQLMDDSWSSPVRSPLYMLGQRVNVQVSTQHPYPGAKLFIKSCYVTTTQNVHQATKYSIIHNFGCLRESLINPDARFRLSTADNIVQFSFDAFQFIDAPNAQVSLHCDLSVSGGGPSPVQKSCFYNHGKNRWISVSGHDSVCDCCDSVCNLTKTKRLIYEGFVNSDQVVVADPATSPSLTFASSTHNNNDAIWFEAKLASESRKSHTRNDFATPVTLSSSEDHFKTQNEFHTSTVKLIEEVKKVMEVENQEDVEILMATSESFVRSERPNENTRLKNKETRQKVDFIEHVASLGRSEHMMKQKLVKGPKKDLEKSKGLVKMSVVDKAVEESYKMDDSALAGGEPQDLILSSVITEEEDESSTNGEENFGFESHSEFEEKSEFPVGFDYLMEQGVVRKIDFTKDPDSFIPEDI